MAYDPPGVPVTGTVISVSSWGTKVRNTLLATGVATVTTAGDIVYATAANAFARLAVGAAGTFLQSVSGLPAYKTLGVRKAADETVSNSAALQNDDELLAAVAASTKYQFTAYLRCSGDGTYDIKFSWTVPAGATVLWSALGYGTAGVFGFYPSTDADPVPMGTNGATVVTVLFVGTVVVAGTAGNLQLQWAQNSAFATDTKVLANSHLEIAAIT